MKTSVLTILLSAGAVITSSAQPPHQPPPPPPDRVAMVIDENLDREFSANEISRAASSLPVLDEDNDGKITREEARPVPAPHTEEGNHQTDGEQRKPPVSPMFRLLDLDQSGDLSQEEIANASKILSEADVNRDGKLETAEIRSLLPPPPNNHAPGRHPMERAERHPHAAPPAEPPFGDMD